MSVIISCGFQAIVTDYFRSKTISKGKKLLASNHVGQVTEEICNDKSVNIIRGKVLRETPGVNSTKKNENFYFPCIQVNRINRSISSVFCSCKAGRNSCKHSAAVCLYVNQENSRSQTDEPMIWNKPPEAQLNKYSKGVTVEALFPSTKGNILAQRLGHDFKGVKDLKNCNESTVQKIISEAEIRCEKEIELRKASFVQKQEKAKEIISHLFNLQCEPKFKSYYCYNSNITKNNTLKISIAKCPLLYEQFYNNEVKVSKDLWFKISLQSINQAQTMTWHNERYIRITASSKAHQIYTRKDNFEILAKQFKKQKYSGNLTEAMKYGITMESVAKKKFVAETSMEVHNVGLIISMDQPFLSCSPDGIIINNNKCELLEIKCPFSCKGGPIIENGSKSLVKYLYFNEQGDIQLKKNDKYYTQIQFSMYVCKADFCHFTVFSELDFIHLIIERDEDFLSTLIPKIELFYFKYFLPELHERT